MGMRQRRCPVCRKRRRFVAGGPVVAAPIDPHAQTKRDSGWRLVEGRMICQWCVQRLATKPAQPEGGAGGEGGS